MSSSLPALPALVQGWYKSPGPWSSTTYTGLPKQEWASDFTGFIQNTRKSLLYRHQETHQYGRGQGRCSPQHAEIAKLLLPSCCHGRIPSTRKKVLPRFCLYFDMRSKARSPSPPFRKHGSDASAPHLFRKSTEQPRNHLG